MEILYFLIVLALGIGLGYFLGKGKNSGSEAMIAMLNRQLAEAKEASERQINDVKAEANHNIATLKNEHVANSERLKGEHAAAVEELKNEHTAFVEKLESKHKEELQELRTAQQKDMQQNIELLKEQLSNSAEQVLKNRSEELSAINKEQLATILNPLQTGIKQMQEAVEKNRMERSETMSQLKTAITMSAEQAEKLGKKTDSLTNALAHDNKYQGNFGEMQLRQMLEDMGLERGRQFEEQVTLRNDAGDAILSEEGDKRMQPDVILHFPDKRDIIIDSKVSLTAFLRYKDESLSEEERRQALKEHVQSVKTQIKNLASKSYWRQYNQKGMKLDFVVMYMFSENALQVAMSEEPLLWKEAYESGVLITGPQNLYALLRILEISWKQMAQVENQQLIIDTANEIVSRVQTFYKRILALDNAFTKVHDTMEDVKKSLAPSGQSIITSATKLIKYGAKENPKAKQSLPVASEEMIEKSEE